MIIKSGISQKDIFNEVIEDGGITLDIDWLNTRFESGYQVSIKDLMKVDMELIQTPMDMMIFVGRAYVFIQELKAVNTHSKADEIYLGIWIEHDCMYFDLSIHIQDKERALRVAKANDQLAIFDWGIMDSVWLEPLC